MWYAHAAVTPADGAQDAPRPAPGCACCACCACFHSRVCCFAAVQQLLATLSAGQPPTQPPVAYEPRRPARSRWQEVLSELARALSRESIDVATRAHVVTMPLCRFLLPVSDNTTRRRRALLAQLCLQSGAAAHLVLALASSSALYLGGPPGPNQSRCVRRQRRLVPAQRSVHTCGCGRRRGCPVLAPAVPRRTKVDLPLCTCLNLPAPLPPTCSEQASAATLAQDVSFLLANVLLPLPAVEPPSVQAALRQVHACGTQGGCRSCSCPLDVDARKKLTVFLASMSGVPIAALPPPTTDPSITTVAAHATLPTLCMQSLVDGIWATRACRCSRR